MQVRSLGQEDTLEEDMATHSSILAEKIPWTEEPGGLWSMHLQESDVTSDCVCTHISLILLLHQILITIVFVI